MVVEGRAWTLTLGPTGARTEGLILQWRVRQVERTITAPVLPRCAQADFVNAVDWNNQLSTMKK